MTMNGITDLSSEISTSKKRTLDYLAPFSGRLPALERNILKYRALEMILIIFYCDHLKRKIQMVADRNVGLRNTINTSGKRTRERTDQGVTGKRSMRVLQELQLIDKEEGLPIRLSPTPTICSVSPWTAGKGRRRRIEEAIRLILDCSENRTGV